MVRLFRNLLFLLLTAFNFYVTNAQVLDSIPFTKFKSLHYSQIYSLYDSTDTKVNSIIKWNRNQRIVSYVLLPWGISLMSFSFNKAQIIPGMAITTLGSLLYLNSSKQRLYKKLTSYELLKYPKNIKTDFNINLEDFTNTSWNKIKEQYVYNETTNFIYDRFHRNRVFKNSLVTIGSTLIIAGLTGAVYNLAQSTTNFEHTFPAGLAIIGNVVPGSVIFYFGIHNRSQYSKTKLYHDFNQYYKTGTVSEEVQEYIIKHE